MNTEHSDPVPFRNSTLHRALSNIKVQQPYYLHFSHPIIVAYCFYISSLGDMIRYSFNCWDGYSDMKFIQFDNYKLFLQNQVIFLF